MDAPTSQNGDAIRVVGARVHNLRNLTVSIPLNALTVITGVSGSGKSSLAFDTLYAEGQRRYVASLSAYARQFLERIDRPDVEDIVGICPALAIRQRTYTRNPRSTVATVTEIGDYLRLLYARIGVTRCHQCGRVVERDTPDRIADFVLSLPSGTRLLLCIPLRMRDADTPGSSADSGRSRARRSDARATGLDPAARLRMIVPGLERQGFARLLVGAEVVELAGAPELFSRNPDADLKIVVDRLIVQDTIRKRLIDSLETCMREAEGRIEILLPADDPAGIQEMIETRFPEIRWTPHPAGTLVKFSDRFECQLCRTTYEEPEPRLFSFNNPFGACPECQGFGNTITLDLDLVIPDKSKSLSQGAVHPWTRPRYRAFQSRLIQFAERQGIPLDVAWSELSEAARTWIVEGKDSFPGILGFFDHLEKKKYKMHVRIFISRYRGYTTCRSCQGRRLRREARDVYVGGKAITEILAMTTLEAARFFAALRLSQAEEGVGARILKEIRQRLDLLLRVGLEYLTLDRLSSTLSGGESQRIQLATSLGSMLAGTLYVLDEPSIGLHPRDNLRLIETLLKLKELGNTVVVVEHDPEIMRSADHIIDLGPRAGENGGRIVAEGDFASIVREPNSLTGRYLSGEARISVPLFRRMDNGRCLELIGARRHNLKDLSLKIPLGMMVCVTGVSGSGKSTLVHDVLYVAIKKAKGELKDVPAGCQSLHGADKIADVVLVDQSPVGRTPRSNPATYVKAFDDIRSIFAETRDAYSRNLGAAHFSFNLSGGRCETCQGSGTITVEMQFLADVELTCEDCRGKRFKPSVLEVTYRGRNIAEVLDLTVHEAMDFFAGHSRLLKKLRVLEEIGLGYLRLGQSATSLSGGEAQRMKLASYIARGSTADSLFIFDEPTTGLHFDDIKKLLAALDKLIGQGNSVIVIEHNMDVIKTADWIIDLGPEGGDAGGEVVFEGSPDDIIACERSYTGQFLRRHLQIDD
ncbi:MAG: excinuclease ABC subunit UvrA [Acidobacteria bacterium]|nr:excinuclease ABC subunit UvrA [Acidobacteriota bacterium]